jgi:hypothetical protein
MTNTKLRLAQGLAIVSTGLFFIFLINTFGGVPPVGPGLIFPVLGEILGAATFILSWRQKSVLISSMLLVGGTILAVNAMIATRFFAILVFPGPITGVILGVSIVGLGIAKSIGTARKLRAERVTTR